MIRALFLAVLAVLVVALVVVLVRDFIRRPDDVWIGATFLAGTLFGVALDRERL
jgi:hypothetical protein